MSFLMANCAHAHVPISRQPGFKQFFVSLPLDTPRLSIRGVGYYEPMPPCMITRKQGTGDFLLMLFHDPAHAATVPIPPPSENPDAPATPPALPDRMMIWKPGVGQFYGRLDADFCHTWIHCEGSRIHRILRESRLPVGQPFHAPGTLAFPSDILAVHRELVSHAHPDEVIVGNLLENALRRIARSRSPDVSPIPENLARVHHWLGTAPAAPVALSDMAQMAGMSVPHFCERFKHTFGIPPMECLIQHRLQHAAWLLTDSNMRISEAARRVGYDDPFHFSKAFRQRFGQSPRSWRINRVSDSVAGIPSA